MLLKDVVEEIAEKSPNFLSPASIVRKVTNVRDRLIRQFGAAQQQSDTVCTAIDIQIGQAQYILPCPPGNVVDVDLLCNYDDVQQTGDWHRIKLRQFNQDSIKPYYYFQAGKIGIVPAPVSSVPVGIKIFHIPILSPLSITDMDSPTGFDPDFDLALVYGVLREITSDKIMQEYDYKYQQIITEYQVANNGQETYAVKERW